MITNELVSIVSRTKRATKLRYIPILFNFHRTSNIIPQNLDLVKCFFDFFILFKQKIMFNFTITHQKANKHLLCKCLFHLNAGGVTLVSANFESSGEGSDMLKYILAALVVPKSRFEPVF